MPETARTEARRILGEVARGQDPAGEKATRRKASTIAELCSDYLDAADRGLLIGRRGSVKKPSTVATDRSRISAHILPLLGTRKVIDVTPQDIRTFMAGVMEGKTAQRVPTGTKRGLSVVRGGKGAAARTMGLLGGIFSYAVQQGLRADNPVTGIQRPADGQRQRRLTEQEYQGFAQGLEALERVPTSGRRMHPPALAAARFLILTGWRLGEVLGLTWDAVDAQARVATLGSTKTGHSVRPLSRAAVALLEAQKRLHGTTVFPPARDAASMSGFISMFRRIAKAGGLPPDVTPHILRHSFASLAGDLGFADTSIGALIGHRSNTVTSRYLHRTDAVLLAAADAVAAETERLMGLQQEATNVVPLPVARVA